MFRKISNLQLIGILVVLVLVYLGIRFWGNQGRSKSLKEELVQLDTAEVTRVVISAADDTVNLVKEAGDWKLRLASGKVVDAVDKNITRALENLNTIKPSRIATKDPEKYKDFSVDSSGTRIRVFEGNDQTLDLIVGRLGMSGQRQFHTFVKLSEDKEVYVAENFMGMSLSADPSSYRDRKLVQLTTDSIAEIRFNYPDSSFVLQRAGNGWTAGNQSADSAKVAQYLNELKFVSMNSFADDTEPGSLGSPDLSLELQVKGIDPLSINAYLKEGEEWLIGSSSNPEVIFRDPELETLKTLFVSKDELVNAEP